MLHAPAGRSQGRSLTTHGAGAEAVEAQGADGVRGGQGPDLRFDATAAAADVQVKVEEVEEYDGSYDCLICCESVRRTRALRCSQCTCSPFHQTCHQSWAQHAKVEARTCPQCAQLTVVPFTR